MLVTVPGTQDNAGELFEYALWRPTHVMERCEPTMCAGCPTR